MSTTPDEVRDALDSFQNALTTGDLQRLLGTLAPDVVLVTDGGGLKQAALRPITGRDNVIRWLGGVLQKTDGTPTTQQVSLNHSPALLIHLRDEIDGALAVTVADGLITGLYYVRNPQKLTRVR